MINDDENNLKTEDGEAFCEYPKHKNSALPAVAIVILVLLLIIGGFYLVRYLKKVDKTTNGTGNSVVSTEVKIPEGKKTESALKVNKKQKSKTEPEKIVDNFYKWYTNSKGNPLKDGSYKTNKSVSDDLAAKIAKDANTKKDFDPFICANSKATGFNVGQPQISDKTSSVVVNITSESGITLPKVNMQLSDGTWKMVNVACLSPSGTIGTIENLKKDIGLNYVTTNNVEFIWSSANYKGANAVTLKGKGIKTTKAIIKTNAIKNFLVKKGFKVDNYNTNGYKKGNVVCIYTDKVRNEKHDVNVKCGDIK